MIMKKHLLLFYFFSITISFAQSSKLKQLEKYLNESDITKSGLIINTINKNTFTANDNAKLNYLKAIYYKSINKDDLAFNQFINAKKQYQSLNKKDTIALINLEIVSLLLAIEKSNVDYKPFLNECLEYANTKNNNHELVSKIFFQVGKSYYDKNPKLALKYFKDALKENSKTTQQLFKGRIHGNIGATYAHDKLKMPDSAMINYNLAQKIYENLGEDNYIFNILMNKGKLLSKNKKFEEAIQYYHKADSITITEYKNKNKEILYGYMAEAYKSIGNFKNSIEYIDKQNLHQDILNEEEQKKAIKELEVKYKTQQKELQIVKLENREIMNYSIIGFLIIVVTTSVLAYKNLSKKKKIIEQEKLLETQKLETTLKEQELHEIDVMLESQEKERQRIANELHDNLGSMLATLKLNFENLKRHDSSPTDTETKLFEKTDDLIEEAYQKVRNISHLKNLGVIGSEGLLIAVKKMAEKMSVIEKLQINVIPHGLNERLENTLEVMLFRMIQELCTNIIKHSEATEVNIYLTQHSDNELNIIIEDNGKGFDPKTVVATSGIGLKSIEKKVEQINGTFTIDSIISKGTTIIIDLPI